MALGPKTVGSPVELAAAVREARGQGFVVVDEEFEPDLIGVAVPVRDPRGSIIASLNVSAPRYRFIERVAAAAQELVTVSADLARELGDPGAVERPSLSLGIPWWALGLPTTEQCEQASALRVGSDG